MIQQTAWLATKTASPWVMGALCSSLVADAGGTAARQRLAAGILHCINEIRCGGTGTARARPTAGGRGRASRGSRWPGEGKTGFPARGAARHAIDIPQPCRAAGQAMP